MAKNIEINVLNNDGNYETLYPQTIIENVTNGASISYITTQISNAKTDIMSKVAEVEVITRTGTGTNTEYTINYTMSKKPNWLILTRNRTTVYPMYVSSRSNGSYLSSIYGTYWNDSNYMSTYLTPVTSYGSSAGASIGTQSSSTTIQWKFSGKSITFDDSGNFNSNSTIYYFILIYYPI